MLHQIYSYLILFMISTLTPIVVSMPETLVQTASPVMLPSVHQSSQIVEDSPLEKLEKQYSNSFAKDVDKTNDKLLTVRWGALHLLKAWEEEAVYLMCQEGHKIFNGDNPFKTCSYKMSQPNLILGSKPAAQVDILECKIDESKIYLMKGSRRNSAYFVKPVDTAPIPKLFTFDEKFNSDQVFQYKFDQVAERIWEKIANQQANFQNTDNS